MERKDEQNYGAEQVQVLEGLEAVRLRPGMYIGSTSAKGLHHLVWEIVDNSVDENMAGFGDEIKVTIHKDNSITVRDFGRGIPTAIHPDKGISTLELVLTVLHSGGKFGGENSAYKSSGGLHGVGSSVTNALSEAMTATVYRDQKIYQMKLSKGNVVSPLKVINENYNGKTGTEIWFKPDPTIFKETTVFDYETIRKRMQESSFLNAKLRITITDERVKTENGYKTKSYFYENGMLDYIKFINTNKKVLHPSPIYLSGTVNDIFVEAAFQYTEEYKENIISYANNIKTYEGGTHETGFKNAITSTLKKVIDAKGITEKGSKDQQIDGSDIRTGLVAVISIKIGNPEFEGQTKTKLGNPEVRSAVQKMVQQKFEEFLSENPKILNSIIDKIMLSYKERMMVKQARQNIRKANKNDEVSFPMPSKLTDARPDIPPSEREIYFVEGDSAGGTAKKAANVAQAILPLRGKILNVEKASLGRIMENEEIRSIITVIGTGIKEDFDISKARYHKVVIMTDADVDGSHIQILMLTFFYRFMRPLIEAGYVYIAMPPLYGLRQKDKIVAFCFNEDELNEKMKQYPKASIQRYKGLGEMNAADLESTTMSPTTRTMIQITIDDAEKANKRFDELMGEDPSPRKQFIEKYAHTVELEN